jgi:hypothetical protein
MKYPVSARDVELISAYLDDQLSPKDRSLLETRLKTEPALRNELQELSQTRLLLHNLPRLRAPRNYYVKAETIPDRTTFRLAPVFGIVSAVASLLLVLVIFGSTFFKTSQPVAMAPVAPMAQQVTNTPPETVRSSIAPEVTNEVQPPLLVSAPKLSSPTSSTVSTDVVQSGNATPTTIYLNAYPPTSTPENGVTINQQPDEMNRILCEEYYGGWGYPTLTSAYDCPTPTPTLTPTPSSTSSIFSNIVSATTSTPTETPTPTSTASPTPTETPTATPSSSPTPSPTATPSPTDVSVGGEKAIPTNVFEAPPGSIAANPLTISVTSTPSPQDHGQGQGSSSPNISFLNYLLLTVEISLATIAVIAGIVAIVLRLRLGR